VAWKLLRGEGGNCGAGKITIMHQQIFYKILISSFPLTSRIVS
jgi:hypothetical protein